MIDKVSIVIPTQDRPFLVRRSIAYYRPLGIPIVIADSSSRAMPVENSADVRYLHLPGMTFARKVHHALAGVKSPYACLCADDDFLALGGLEEGVRFLDSHQDYASVGGTFIQFSARDGEMLSTHILYAGKQEYAIEEPAPGDRVVHAFEDYMNCMVALYRTPVLREALALASVVNEVTVAEMSTNLVGNLFGKHRTLPVFWMARDAARYSAYVTLAGDLHSSAPEREKKSPATAVVVDWATYVASPAGRRWRDEFANVYARVTGGGPGEGASIFDTALQRYIEKHPPKRPPPPEPPRPVRRVLRNVIPEPVLRFRRRFLKRVKHPSLPGYPWTSETGLRDWTAMQAVIFRSPVR